MATTINAYSVSLGLDSSNYIDSSKLSRAEASALRRDIASARDPMEKLQIEQDRLTKALNQGAISLEAYNRLLDHYTQKANKAADATEKKSSSLDTFSKIGNVVTGIRQGLMMVGDAVGFVADGFEAFNEVTNAIDDTNDAAKKLGLSFNELGSLRFAADRLGGGDAAGAIDKALGEMLKRGLLQTGESAVDAFKRVADQVQQAATQTERAQIAADAFGKSGIEILAVLQSGSGEIENLVSQWEKTNSLSGAQLEGIAQYNDRWDDVLQSVTGVRNVFVAELAPLLTTFSEHVLGIDTSFQSVTALARDMADMIVGYVGLMKDAATIAFSVAKLSTGDISGAMSAFGEGIQFNSAEEMLLELEKKRATLQSQANEEYIKQIETRKNAAKDATEKEKDDYKDLINGNAEVWDKFIEQRNDSIKLSSQALSAAEKELARKQQRPQLLSLEVGSAEAARYLAEQANLGTEAKPTEEEILEEAVKQREILEQQRLNEEAMKQKLQELVEVAKENGFKRIR